MSKQNYVRLKVELSVNGVSCPISEEMFGTILVDITISKFERNRRKNLGEIPSENFDDLPPNIMAEILKSRQVDHRNSVAVNPDITKEAVAALLEDEQLEVIKTLVGNESALNLMTSKEIYELAVRTSDINTLRNLASVFDSATELPLVLSENTQLIQHLIKNPDIEVRKYMVKYLSGQRIEAEKYNVDFDTEMESMINKSIESMRQERKGES